MVVLFFAFYQIIYTRLFFLSKVIAAILKAPVSVFSTKAQVIGTSLPCSTVMLCTPAFSVLKAVA